MVISFITYLCTGSNKALAITKKTVSLCCISWRTSWIMKIQDSTTDILKSCLKFVNLVIGVTIGNVILQRNYLLPYSNLIWKKSPCVYRKFSSSLPIFTLDIHNQLYFLEYINRTYDILESVFVKNMSEIKLKWKYKGNF